MEIKKFQQGGVAPVGAPSDAMAPAPQGGGDPVMELVAMAEQALQAQDPGMALAVCEGLLSLAGGAAGGGAPGGAPAPAQEPVMMRRGGKMCKKASKGRKC